MSQPLSLPPGRDPADSGHLTDLEKVISIVTAWVREAEKQALLAYSTREGINKRWETESALNLMSLARGALSVLKALRPATQEVEELESRLNHCVVLMVAGDGRDCQQRLQPVN